MTGTFTVQMDEEEFRIVGPDGEAGEAVSYDECATLTIDEDVYICRVDDPDAETQSVEQVTQTRLMTTAIEEVDFTDDDGGGPDDGEPVAVVEEKEEEPAA